MSPKPSPPLLNTRAALILLLGLLSGAAAGGLTHLAGSNHATTLLAGLVASGSATTFFHKIIG